MSEIKIKKNKGNLYLSSLFGGGMAGLFVDMILFPLDTIKTRLQAAQGFQKAGGFNSIYKGIGPQFIGSIPTAALFFCTYETFNSNVKPLVSSKYYPLVYMTGASISEVMSCFVRVPVEVVKQRMQTSSGTSAVKVALDALRSDGLFKGLYRGFGSTVLREIPFSLIQFPILEYLKVVYSKHFTNDSLKPHQVAMCGSVAGGIAAAVTTPLDVVKTRIMLANTSAGATLKVPNMFVTVYKEKGFKGFFT